MEDKYTKASSFKQKKTNTLAIKALFTAIIITTLATLSYFYIRSTHYQYLDLRNTGFMQYYFFCRNNNNGQITATPEQQQSNENENLEHVKASHLKSNFIPSVTIPENVWDDLPVKGVYYMIVSNKKIQAAKSVIQSIQDNMSKGSRYPWVILNHQDFDEKFQKYVTRVTGGNVFFGKINTEAWEYPSWIDVPRAEYFMLQQGLSQNVVNSHSLLYHQRLRYQTGYFFHHPLFRNVQYAWRVEPGAEYNCNMDYDPFVIMKENNKKLGYVLTGKESENTMPTLMGRVKEFMADYPDYILPENQTIRPWIMTDSGDYNNCYMWTNFQIVDLSFFRMQAYQTFFDFLDNTGNFFYERWGDGPIHTIAAALFLKKEDIHFFNSIGYAYSDMTHCPYNDDLLRKCSCDIEYNDDFNQNSCTIKLLQLTEPELINEMSTYIAEKKLSIKNIRKKSLV